MTEACTASPTLGVAVRLANYLDCEARALGELGFQAVLGGPVGTDAVSAVMAIFVALIGYRLILSRTPVLRDGAIWTAKLGIVLTLLTGWPAFQTLFYRTAIDGPTELAAAMLPAVGLPSENLAARVQLAYDMIRLGPADRPPESAPSTALPPQTQTAPSAKSTAGQPTLPQTARLFVVATVGAGGALRIAAGFLLAVAPLAILGLLFDATAGLFTAWLRALIGSALGALASTVVIALELGVIESELAHLRSEANPIMIDPQAIEVIVPVFGVVMLAAILVSIRTAGWIRLPAVASLQSSGVLVSEAAGAMPALPAASAPPQAIVGRSEPVRARSRAAATSDALSVMVDRGRTAITQGHAAGTSHAGSSGSAGFPNRPEVVEPFGSSGRRTTIRRTRSAERRDRRS